MKELILIGLTTVLGIGCVSEDEGDVVSEQFELATAHSWLGDGQIFTELLDDQGAVIANATWTVGEDAGTIEAQEQSFRVDVAGSDLTRELANTITYASWDSWAHDDVPYWICDRWLIEQRDGCYHYGVIDCYTSSDGESRFTSRHYWDCYR